MTFGKRDLRKLYQALRLAILMEETCADCNSGKPWAPNKEMRIERKKNLKRVIQFTELQDRIAKTL